MIRHPIQELPTEIDDLEHLKNLIEQTKPGWLTRALSKTKEFQRAGSYSETSSIWSEIKDVFLDLQHGKCAYCERKLGGKSYNRKEYDVEHYRPKSNVGQWPSKKVLQKLIESGKASYKFATGDASDTGYYLLPYNILNYTVACTGCNSTLKSSFFPVAKKRVLTSEDFEVLKKEEPFLLFPLGEWDDDPEEYITFNGILPVPKGKRGRKYRRARITIDFFDLDIRPELIEERAGIILAVWLALETLEDAGASADLKATAKNILDAALSPKKPHTNCARSFYKLCKENKALAREVKTHAERINQDFS
jgi:hypothetical protein